ncbi:hypothetical protein EVAR_23310_1 [Eumeta japonica]|uniref:Uncharacterized protein n=1 Tax=Eumeta variegata TaxID=151549 RepID=A0A4C1Y0T6_EUMVA|nr:hypothetical protein EVAR_23310_1 [Eumeta japonica]
MRKVVGEKRKAWLDLLYKDQPYIQRKESLKDKLKRAVSICTRAKIRVTKFVKRRKNERHYATTGDSRIISWPRAAVGGRECARSCGRCRRGGHEQLRGCAARPRPRVHDRYWSVWRDRAGARPAGLHSSRSVAALGVTSNRMLLQFASLTGRLASESFLTAAASATARRGAAKLWRRSRSRTSAESTRHASHHRRGDRLHRFILQFRLCFTCNKSERTCELGAAAEGTPPRGPFDLRDPREFPPMRQPAAAD